MANFPLVGAAYKFDAQTIDCQTCVNWYPQVIETPNGARVSALIPTAGLESVYQGDVAPVRTLHVLSNGMLLAVIGRKLYYSHANQLSFTRIDDQLINGVDPVSIADNGTVAMIVNGSDTYSFNLKTFVLIKLEYSPIIRANSVAFLDGRFVLNKKGTGQFVWTKLYSTDIDPLSFATAEASPDPLTRIVQIQSELWLIGTRTTERYYSTGDASAPYARISGGYLEIGCTAPYSICRMGVGVAWLTESEFGGRQVVIASGGQPQRITTHALEQEFNRYSRVDDARAYVYQDEGHVFYVITFPSANITWVYDLTTQLWHRRAWADQYGQQDRHRSQCHAFYRGLHLVGDWQNGKIYALKTGTYTDDGDRIIRERTCPAMLTGRNRTVFSLLEIVCETGHALPVAVSGYPSAIFNDISPTGLYRFTFGAETIEGLFADITSDLNNAGLLTAVDGTTVTFSVSSGSIEFECEVIDASPTTISPSNTNPTAYADMPFFGATLTRAVNAPDEPVLLVDWSDDRGHHWSNARVLPLGKIGQTAKRVETRRMGSGVDRVYRIRCQDPINIVLVEGRIS